MGWIDWIIAASLMIVAIVSSFYFVLSKTSMYRDVVKIFELKNVAINYLNKLLNPQIGLTTEIYRIPIFIRENASLDRTNELVSLPLVLDEDCKGKAWQSTIRLINLTGEKIPFNITSTYCFSNFVKEVNLTFLLNLTANSSIFYFLYFSPEQAIEPLILGELPGNIATPIEIKIFPIEKVLVLSISKLKELKNLNYEDVVKLLGGYDFNLEIKE